MNELNLIGSWNLLLMVNLDLLSETAAFEYLLGIIIYYDLWQYSKVQELQPLQQLKHSAILNG